MHIAVRMALGRNGGSTACFLLLRGAVCCQAYRYCGDVTQRKETAATIAAPQPLQQLPDVFDMDEAMTLNVYRPHSTEERPQGGDATKLFLHAIITTGDEQEWKDMLCAAIRLNTLREHHVRAVIRGVHQAQYDVDCPAEAEGGGGGGRRPRGIVQSTPATRLQRAVEIVQAAVYEGYKVAPESVHALLVILLRAVSCYPADGLVNTHGKNNEDAPPQLLTSRAVVWRFLAWMERHNYHVMSTAVLEALELIVEDDVLEKKSTEQKVSVRQNRLEYLRNEHDRLTRGANAQQQRGGKVQDTPQARPHKKGL